MNQENEGTKIEVDIINGLDYKLNKDIAGLEFLGKVKTNNYHYDDYPGVIGMEDPWKVRGEADIRSINELKERAMEMGADYVVAQQVHSWPEMHLEGRAYKIIR